MRSVVLYSRPGCVLCDEAREVILRVQREHPFDLIELDIETDDTLLRDYSLRIPVVTVDGEEAFEVSVPAEGLAELVRM
jgi:hypothetical protein